MIFLLAGCVGMPMESNVDAIWPFPRATGVDTASGVVIDHDVYMSELPYGVSRVYALSGPQGEVPFTATVSDIHPSWLVLQPDAPLPLGSFQLTVSQGTDSSNFDEAYRRPSGLPDSLEFSTTSAPDPLCWGWYDLDDAFLSAEGAPGRLACIHWTEPLVPGWVDLGADQFEADGVPLKTSGLVPAAFPELLCAILPDSAAPASWTLRVTPEDVVTEAGGTLFEDQSVSTETRPGCDTLDLVLPRWRPDEE